MKFCELAKDGGPESHVWGYWLLEIKSLFSIVLLRFENGSRDAYHNHAFNCISWVLKGELAEHVGAITTDPDGNFPEFTHGITYNYRPSLKPVFTYRTTNHKVVSYGRTWVLSFRGPWAKTWKETVNGEEIVLTEGRKVVGY